jgi:hypothetical protein
MAGTTTTDSTSEEFRSSCYLLDSSIFLAYAFDLICCLYFGVIPFSRCNCSRDIVGHHVPTLLLALPLAVPLWSGRESLRFLDSTSFSIMDDPTVNGGIRGNFITAYSMASGFAYVSSLNEVFMCLQRVEVSFTIHVASRKDFGGMISYYISTAHSCHNVTWLDDTTSFVNTYIHSYFITQMSLAGVSSFRDVPTMGRRRFLTSRMGLCAELCYKLVFFWGMSIIACKACFDFDGAVYDYILTTSTSTSRWNTLLAVYSSPAVLRGALFRAFSVAMYPSMGMRCLKKIGQLRREGNGGGREEEENGSRKVVS